jgi:alkanesulfonate monooxygenase SsuD/methylene tetrahydromethanopterin reductase-like flavin-dependent oxidoreductase (luciferase family)
LLLGVAPKYLMATMSLSAARTPWVSIVQAAFKVN